MKKKTIRDTRKLLARQNIFAHRMYRGKWYLFKFTNHIQFPLVVSSKNHKVHTIKTHFLRERSKVRNPNNNIWVAAKFPNERAAYTAFLIVGADGETYTWSH